MAKQSKSSSNALIDIDIGISKDRAAIAEGLNRLPGRDVHALPHHAQLPLERDRADVQHPAHHVHDAVHRTVERGRPHRRAHPRPGPPRFRARWWLRRASTLPDAPAEPPKAREMVRQLVIGHETVARTARSLFLWPTPPATRPTADLLTQRLDVHEKTA